MKLKKHSVKQVDIPDVEVKVTTVDILRKLINETLSVMHAEIGYRRSQLDHTRDLVIALENLERAGMYVLRSLDDNRLDMMKEYTVDEKATKELKDRTS